jgi:hypothetical protein
LKKRSIYLTALAIAAIGIAIFLVKLDRLGLPLVPNQDTAVWTIEARARFEAKGGPLTARLEIPDEPLGFEILDEDFISSNYGVTTEHEELHRTSIWTVRRAKGKQSVYYRMSVVEADAVKQHTDEFPGFPERPEREEALDSAIEALLEKVRLESADTVSFTGALIRRVNKLEGDGAVGLLNDGEVTASRRALQLVDILASARIPARVVWGILLEDEVRDGKLTPFVEVHNQSVWLPFDPLTGEKGYPDRFPRLVRRLESAARPRGREERRGPFRGRAHPARDGRRRRPARPEGRLGLVRLLRLLAADPDAERLPRLVDGAPRRLSRRPAAGLRRDQDLRDVHARADRAGLPGDRALRRRDALRDHRRPRPLDPLPARAAAAPARPRGSPPC